MTKNFRVSVAVEDNLPEICLLMQQSIKFLQKEFLSNAQISASFEVMGLDTQLIEDQTYFVVQTENTLVGCGGWSWRKTLYGGNHTAGRSDKRLDPLKEAARIRAMYTHPKWIRRGIGKIVLKSCENAAYKAGFKRAEMMATLAGVPLYKACGYTKIETDTDISENGVKIPLVRMGKQLMALG